jgi:iron only hydrogenase large subunit-like protein
MLKNKIHTVILDTEKCVGCITCMRRCPTEAIRIVDGKARIDYDKCINCGECIRSCPNRAKRPVYDSFDIINNYKYKIALPSPSLFGQFNNLENIDYVLTGLKRIGFDKVFEVSRAAEIVSDCTKKVLKQGKIKKPVISTACPAVVELILIRFHNLKDNLLPVLSPAAVAARLAREEAVSEGINPKDIGVFFISPCPAKVYALKSARMSGESYVDGVLAQSEVYFKLLNEMNKIDVPEKLSKSSFSGLGWGRSGGESDCLRGNYIHCDGVRNILSVLTEIEDDKLGGVDFVELNVCPGGCVGGVLNIENPFVARSRINQLKSKLDKYENNMASVNKDIDFFKWKITPETLSVYQLDSDRDIAMQKMVKVEQLLKTLPNINCGECGAPTCRCYAEDVVMGNPIGKCPKINE